MRSIKYMVLSFIGVVILCVYCISYLSYQDGKDIILRTTERYYRFVLLEVARSIEQRVTKVLGTAVIASHTSSIKTALMPGGTAEEQAQRREKARVRLDSINAATPESTSLALINAQGQIVLDTEGIFGALQPDLGDAGDASSPLSKLRSGNHYVGQQMHPDSNSVIIFAMVPVITGGSYHGAVFTSLNMETFPEVWRSPLLSLSEVRLTLLDAQKNVIICSDDYFTAGMNYLEKYDTDVLFSSMGELIPLRADGLRVGMHWHVPDINWSIVIGVDRAALLAPTMELLRDVFLTSTFMGLLTIILTVLMFRFMQRRLRESEATLAQTIDAASIATWEWDGGQNVMRVNRFFNRILGYNEGSAVYTQEWCQKNMHPNDYHAVNGKLPECAEYFALSREFRFKSARGEWQWVRSFGAVRFDKQSGKVLSGKGLFVDIQARKEVEAVRIKQQQRLEVLVDERTAALQESNSTILRERALLDSVLNSIPDIIYYKDTEGKYVGCNTACVHTFGITMKDIIGKTETELGVFSSTTLRDVAERDQQAYLSQGPYWYEQVVKLNSGKVIIFETVKKVFSNEYGVIQGLVGISRNITERKRAEEELLRARQAANAANQAKSDFLANMSHEIRTPLNGIMGLNYLAMQEEPPPKVMDYLQKITSSAQNLALIINDILDFSKIEAGKLELDYSAFSLRDIVQSTFDMLEPMADKKGISLRVEHIKDVPSAFMGDPLRLSQVLLNLLSNAIKFTSVGFVALTFEVKKRSDAQVSFVIKVQDTGIGMTSEQISRLFTAFTQADASTTRQYGGTGLGLTICKSIIDLMGGSISVSSVPGEGSCFSFTLDLDIADNRSSKRLVTGGFTYPLYEGGADNLAATIGNSLQGTRVLLTEDNDINQVIAQELLQSMGCNVDIANDGQEAVSKALNTHYDIILMDIQMPVMDGFSATRILRGHSELNDIPIIAMTAHAMTSDREKSLSVGMQDHITKPIDPMMLEQTIFRWVKGQTPRQEP